MNLPTDPDARSLAIGVVGGLIVIGLVAVWRVVRSAGLAGLVHFRRSLVRSNLPLIEAVGPNRERWLAILILLNTVYVATAFVVASATFLVTAGMEASHTTVSAYWAGVLAGSVPSLIIGFTAYFLHASITALYAVANYPALLRRLRRIAADPYGEPSDLPAEDSQQLVGEDHPARHQ